MMPQSLDSRCTHQVEPALQPALFRDDEHLAVGGGRPRGDAVVRHDAALKKREREDGCQLGDLMKFRSVTLFTEKVLLQPASSRYSRPLTSRNSI